MRWGDAHTYSAAAEAYSTDLVSHSWWAPLISTLKGDFMTLAVMRLPPSLLLTVCFCVAMTYTTLRAGGTVSKGMFFGMLAVVATLASRAEERAWTAVVTVCILVSLNLLLRFDEHHTPSETLGAFVGAMCHATEVFRRRSSSRPEPPAPPEPPAAEAAAEAEAEPPAPLQKHAYADAEADDLIDTKAYADAFTRLDMIEWVEEHWGPASAKEVARLRKDELIHVCASAGLSLDD